MNREELRRYIMEEYHAKNDFPWLRHPENEVYVRLSIDRCTAT